MIENSRPTRAEIQDITSAILDGVYGLTLSAETAIGKHPIRCVNIMNRVIKHVETISQVREISDSRNLDYDKLLSTDYFENYYITTASAEPPHGGRLVDRTVLSYDHSEISHLPKIHIDMDTEMDVVQIATGAFSPLEGFMNEDDLNSVLDTMKLSNGCTWPLPIVLDFDKKDVDKISVDEKCCLIGDHDRPLATLKVEQVYDNDKNVLARSIYGTEDQQHPGVARIISKKSFLVAGKVTLLDRRVSEMSQYELTPLQLRKLFVEKGWEKVAGFHTRNVPHRGHEHILLKSIEDELCDGILLHPVIGSKKKGDFSSKYILKSYEMLIKNHLPQDRFVLSAFNTYSHYAGPREAIFTAICRKNYGCTHFIVGRDHTGVASYYGSKDSQKAFNEIKDLGIGIIFFDEIVYSKTGKEYFELDHSDNNTAEGSERISGSGFREFISRSKLPPSWYAREDVSNMLLDSISNGDEVFV
jgi:ATP sulfurylase